MWHLRLYKNDNYRYPVARPTYDVGNDENIVPPGSVGFLLGEYMSYDGVRLDEKEWVLAIVGSHVIILNRHDFQEEDATITR